MTVKSAVKVFNDTGINKMFDPKMLDELAQKLAASVPSGVQELQADLEKNFRSTLQTMLGKMDLVTREEFDVQTQVLARTRAKLETLEAQVNALEEALKQQTE